MTTPVCMSPMFRTEMAMLDEVNSADRARRGRVTASRIAMPVARMPSWNDSSAKEIWGPLEGKKVGGEEVVWGDM